MLKSCKYCGRIHEAAFICPHKQEALDRQRERANRKRGHYTQGDKYRTTRKWRDVRNYVIHRDRRLCLCCLAELEGTETRYNTEDLSVHHITPIKEDYNRKNDETNLITVCRYHHEMCEAGAIPRDKQRQLAAWSAEGFIDLSDRMKEYELTADAGTGDGGQGAAV